MPTGFGIPGTMSATGGWHPEDIKAALRKQHGSLAVLNRRWGYKWPAISLSLISDESRVVERRIAETLQVSLHELWPDRWNPDGTSRPRRRRHARPDNSGRKSAGKRQKRESAE